MSGIALESLTSAFQGVAPATLHTCSRDGIPNVALLSHVEYVDSRHVALSHQFFNKSRKNISENPQASLSMYDPDTFREIELKLRYVRSETEGPLFDAMALRIDAVASHCGLKGVFKLLASDVYEVLSIRASGPNVPAAQAIPNLESRVSMQRALTALDTRMRSADRLECLLEATLATLEEIFGFRHSMILMNEPGERRLTTLVSRGYPKTGAGSTVAFGDGLIGMVAESCKPIRVSGMVREMLYARTIREESQRLGRSGIESEISLPGLTRPEYQLGIPLLAGRELVGVLAIESETAFRFHQQDKEYFEIIGSYIALAMRNMMFLEQETDSWETERLPPKSVPAKPSSTKPLELAYFRADECVFAQGEYLIRGLPAKILWKILQENKTSRRTEFTNRELRMDRSLQLPAIKDNLESRLVLLKKRLEEKCPDLRLESSGRGKFCLAFSRELLLTEKP